MWAEAGDRAGFAQGVWEAHLRAFNAAVYDNGAEKDGIVVECGNHKIWSKRKTAMISSLQNSEPLDHPTLVWVHCQETWKENSERLTTPCSLGKSAGASESRLS